jgi:hypothetical protein
MCNPEWLELLAGFGIICVLSLIVYALIKFGNFVWDLSIDRDLAKDKFQSLNSSFADLCQRIYELEKSKKGKK